MQGIKPTILVPHPSPKVTLLLPPHTISISISSSRASRISFLRRNASSPSTSDPLTVDYNSLLSVFPAEACETISGYACSADIYPEVNLKTKPVSRPVVPEALDREYLDYNNPKTVFLEEACDDLGGEFCEPDYQKDVY